MKMNYKSILSTVSFAALCVSGVAAEVDKQVEVTKAYIPTVKQAEKLHLTPDMTDDSYIQPDIDYSITPVSIETKYNTTPYNPVSVNLDEYEPTKRYYTKLGVGLPLQSVVDIYATPIKSKRGYVMGYFNQSGQFAKIENDFGSKESARENHIRGGISAAKYFERKTLEGGVSYNNNRYSRYAITGSNNPDPLYQSVDARIGFGDNFTDLNRLNFGVEGAVEQFWSRYGYSSTSYDAAVRLARRIGGGAVHFGLGYDGVMGSDDYTSGMFNVGLNYAYDGDYWGVKLGAQYLHDNILGSSNYVTPDVELYYHLSRDKAVAYASSCGAVERRDFASLTEINPYVAEGLFAPKSGVEYRNALGIKGRVAKGRLGYNLHVDYDRERDHLYWALLQNSTTTEFVASLAKQSVLSANLDVEYLPVSNFVVWAELSVADYMDDKRALYESGDAQTSLAFGARYELGRWRFGVDTEMLSRREYSVLDGVSVHSESVSVPTTVDLGVDVEYTLRNKMVLFVESENLLNQDLYRWVGYRDYGICVMAGVKLEF